MELKKTIFENKKVFPTGLVFFFIFKTSSRNRCWKTMGGLPFSHKSVSEVGHWCRTIRPGSLSTFQFTLKLFDGRTEVKALCRSAKLSHTNQNQKIHKNPHTFGHILYVFTFNFTHLLRHPSVLACFYILISDPVPWTLKLFEKAFFTLPALCTCIPLSPVFLHPSPSLSVSLCSDSVIHGGIIFPLSVHPIIVSLTSPGVSGEY